MRNHLLRSAALLCGLFSAAAAGAQTKPMTAEEVHRLHQDSKAYIAMLEDPARDAYQKPHEVLMALKLRAGERIADIGAGAGYFSFRFANHVGTAGRVYAVDINPDMVLHMNRRIRDLGVENVQTVLAPPDDPLLRDHSVDRFFICETWHHIDNHPHYLELMKRMLKPGGQVIVIDFHKRETPVGPPPEMRVSREETVGEFERNGFKVAAEYTFLPYQYFEVFTLAGPAGRK
jgi:ubiquinone/menaquinone biosynthesis C-methylase UbiE